VALVKLAFAIPRDCKTQDDTRSRGNGNSDNEAGETKQAAKGQKRENQPNWMKTDRFTNKHWRQNIALEELANQNDGQ
jgi:hypothetical protein